MRFAIRGVMMAAIGAATLAAPAQAEWYEATGRHVVVYANDSADAVRKQAEQLERFDAAIRLVRGLPDTDLDTSNKLTVYVVVNDSAVQRLFGAGGKNIAGFYDGRASGTVAFTPGRSDRSEGGLDPQIVLFHEYAHHALLGHSELAVPRWYSEGFAEFMSTTRFDKDVFWIGAPAQHRAYTLLEGQGMSAEKLFATDRRKLSDSETSELYARGWLLTHVLALDRTRAAQFATYLTLFNQGMPSSEAATKAFGDLKALNKEMNKRLSGSNFPAYKLSNDRLPKPEVSLRPLRPGEKAMIALRMRSDRGVNRETAQPILAEATPIAAKYADDPVVQGWFAEMALDAGRNDVAEAAADRALALDPKSSQALVYKAQVHLRRASAAHAKDPAVWKEARSWLLKANKLDNNDAYALMLYYSSFGMAHDVPTANAKAALAQAHMLVPQDEALTFAYGVQSLLDGKTDDARLALRTLAYSPHAPVDNPAARLLAQIDAGKTGPAALAAAGGKKDDVTLD